MLNIANAAFKYQSEIDVLINEGAKLPPLSEPQNKDAYRYVFREINPNNHKPVYIQNPQRIISDTDKKRINTSGYALSCFEQKDKAIQKYNALKANMRNIARTMGDALCNGTLNKEDGLITPANNESHFDLYEYCECDLSDKFKIIKILI